jgi:hypothetical protein
LTFQQFVFHFFTFVFSLTSNISNFVKIQTLAFLYLKRNRSICFWEWWRKDVIYGRHFCLLMQLLGYLDSFSFHWIIDLGSDRMNVNWKDRRGNNLIESQPEGQGYVNRYCCSLHLFLSLNVCLFLHHC